MLSGTADKIPEEIVDFILIRDLYHCTPSQLDNENADTLELHFALLTAQKMKAKAPTAQRRIDATRSLLQ